MMRNTLCSIAVAMLAGCAQPSAPAKSGIRPDAASAVAAIRAAATQFDSSVEVQPLRDPAVEGWLRQAHEHEAQQRVPQALETLGRALKLTPNAPDLLQYQAELLIENGDWKAAAAAAQKSYDLGPKVGALCARNLQTLVEVRSALHDDAGAQQARQQLSSCRVPAPARF